MGKVISAKKFLERVNFSDDEPVDEDVLIGYLRAFAHLHVESALEDNNASEDQITAALMLIK